MIKYLGSKRRVLPHIVACVGALPDVRTVLDLFSGTARVGHALKRLGLAVHANDHNAYAAALAICYVQADARRWLRKAERLIAELDVLPGAAGWFTETYCERARFLRPENGARVDAIRARIAALSLEPELEAIALVSLIEAADRVDSTVGLQMAYLKTWAPRAFQRLTLRVPELLPGRGSATCLDAAEAAALRRVDLAYLDPPYNQHSYLGNYHVWETLVRWDDPETYGTAQKRVDCRERKSDFNSRARCAAAFREVVAALDVRALVVSFSDEGFLAREEIESVLGTRGRVLSRGIDSRRYVGAQIGIHNLKGEKVGQVGHLRNTEFLYLCLCDPSLQVPDDALEALPAGPAAR